jgi:hypothetical protein
MSWLYWLAGAAALGVWLVAVAEGRLPRAMAPFVAAERSLYRLAGVDESVGMGWRPYVLVPIRRCAGRSGRPHCEEARCDDSAQPRYIVTEPGVGYRLRVD